MLGTTLIVVYFTVVLQVRNKILRWIIRLWGHSSRSGWSEAVEVYSWPESLDTQFKCPVRSFHINFNIFTNPLLSLLQGISMKPLVTWLKVKRAAVTELTLIEKVQNKVKSSDNFARVTNKKILVLTSVLYFRSLITCLLPLKTYRDKKDTTTWGTSMYACSLRYLWIVHLLVSMDNGQLCPSLEKQNEAGYS